MMLESPFDFRLCVKHPEEEMDLYCKKCKISTCNECLKSDHLGHDFDTISKLFRKIYNQRKDTINCIEGKTTPKRIQSRRLLLEVRSRNDHVLKMNLENAEEKRTEMHEAVDKIINEYIDSLNSHSVRLGEGINKKEARFERDDSAIAKMLDTFRSTTMTGLDLIKFYERLQDKAKALKAVDVSSDENKHVFRKGGLDLHNLRQMIGEIKEVNAEDTETTYMSSFTHKETVVHSVCPISRYESWITYHNAKEFTMLSTDGHKVRSVLKDTLRHSFVLHDNFFLLCNQDNNNILKLDTSGKMSTSVWVHVAPLLPRFIGKALNGNILVSLVDEESGYRTTESQRKVQMLTSSGNLLHTYEHGKDGASLVLTLPCRMTQNFNSNVCIVNSYQVSKEELRGNICVFHEDGGLKFVYNGRDGEFRPTGICCDSLCNIICANAFGSTIHVVDSEGEFLKFLFIRETCILQPLSFALHKDVLWVGSYGGEIRVYKYRY